MSALSTYRPGFVLWGRQQDDTAVKKAEIYYDNKLIAVIVLTEGEERTFNFRNARKYSSICLREHHAFRESLSDKVCIKSGELSRVNDWAASLPNRVLLKIVASADDADPDQLDLIG